MAESATPTRHRPSRLAAPVVLECADSHFQQRTSKGLSQIAKKKSAKQSTTNSDVQGERRSEKKILSVGDDVLHSSGPFAPRGVQSTIEEMESPTEELQSLNEQLKGRVAQRTTELELQEREFRTLVANVPALFSFVGPDQRYRYVNRRYEEMFQQPASEIVGKTVEQLLGWPRYEVVRPHIEAVLRGEAVRYEAEFDFADGPHSRGLVPVEVDAEGLRSALSDLASRITEQYGVRCDFQCAGTVELSDTFVATHLYRIAQEAINNAIKHGRTKEIDISLSGAHETITLSVLDNGVGIAGKRDSGPGMGLRIMQYRAGLIGATARIVPGDDQGTQVSCMVLRGGTMTNTDYSQPEA